MSDLTFELLESGLHFEPVEVTIDRDLLAAYAAALGLPSPGSSRVVPPGFAPLLARRSYLDAYSMPPGGVLLGQDVAWFDPVEIGRPLCLRARVASTAVRRRRIAVIETAVRQDGPGPAARIETTVSWP